MADQTELCTCLLPVDAMGYSHAMACPQYKARWEVEADGSFTDRYAVSDPGAGQQQGREVCECGHGTPRHAGVQSPTQLWACFDCPCAKYRPAPSSAPPARDSGRDESREAARDAIGQLLSEWTASQRWWIKASEADREPYREDAYAVLDLPAVRRLLESAAPTTCHHLLGEHSRVPGVGCLVYLAPAVDGDPLTLCPCTHPGTSDADQ